MVNSAMLCGLIRNMLNARLGLIEEVGIADILYMFTSI